MDLRVLSKKSGINSKMIQNAMNFLQLYLWNAQSILVCMFLST
jgi:hypothetical protein